MIETLEIEGVYPEQARAWFDAEEDFTPIVESVEEVEEAALEEG